MRKLYGLTGLTHGFIIRSNASKFPGKPAVVDIERNRRLTYAQLNDRVNRLANTLDGMGIGKGDKVALLMRDRLEFIEIMYAVNKIGAVWVPINYRSIAGDIEFVVKHSDAVCMFFEGSYSADIDNLKPGLNIRPNRYVVIDGGRAGDYLDYEELLAKASPSEPDVDVADTDLCSMIYTSGTTGGPKGAMRTHRTSLGWAFDAIIGFHIGFDDRVLTHFPLFHQGGSVLSICALTLGATVYIPGAFDPRKTLKIIQDEGINTGAFPATVSNFLMKLNPVDRAGYDVSSMRRIINGASALMSDTKEALLEYFINAQLYDHLSCTEAFYTVLPAVDARRKDRCVGLPGFGMEVRLLNDNLEDVRPGEPGIIYGRGISVFDGYYKNPEANAKAFAGEWFTAEDVGRFDEEGYLYVIDRRKDMILSGGENISSIEVENVILNHPGVMEVAAIGIPDSTWGEHVHILVVLKEGEVVTEEEIIDWCKDKLAGFKRPRSVEFLPQLPKNAAGKILKRELRDRYWTGREFKI